MPNWLRRKQREQDLDRELRAHLELEAEEQGKSGLSAEEARYAARRALGNTALVKEEVRDVWTWVFLDRLKQDLIYALRGMRRAPGFTAVAVLSLAFGIGANTAIFNLIDALILRRLPVREPEKLAELLWRGGHDLGGTPSARYNAFSWPTYLHLRDANTVFSGLIGAPTDRFYTRTQGRDPERVEGQYVSGNFFGVLGIRPVVGRLIAPEDDRLGAPAPVAVVSWTYWQTRFRGDPSVLGASLTVEDVPFTIIGVLPPEFTGIQAGSRQDVSIPLAAAPLVRQRLRSDDHGSKWIRLLGRLKPGVSIQQARAEMSVLFRWTLDQEAQFHEDRRRPGWTIEVEPAASGLARLRDQFAKPLFILMSVVGMLLLIACANVASMLLARASARERELAVRISLGAGRLRLARQMLTESLLLSAIAAAFGIGLAYLCADLLVAILNSGRLPIDLAIRPDARVLAFTVLAALVTGVLFGAAPAARASAFAPAAAMYARGTEGRRGRWFGRSLVVLQVALSTVLLASAGLFVQNLAGLERIDLGFRRDHVLMAALDPSHGGYQPDALARNSRQLLVRIAAVPGVRSASLAWIAPISGGGTSLSPQSVEGYTFQPGEMRTVYVNWVAPRYFETLGTPLIAGRDFRDGEPPGTAIVTESLARRFFGNRNPLGRHFSFDGHESLEIVGVVGDSRYMEVREEFPRTVYLNAFVPGRSAASQLLIRTSVDPAALAGDVRRAVRGQMPAVAVGKITTLAAHVDASLVQERLIATLSGLFGGLGTLLAAVGLYGLLTYTVSRSTNEIGIRLALGATRSEVLWTVVRQLLLLLGMGMAIGVPAAWAGARVVSSMLFGTKGAGLLTIGAATLVLTATGLVAGFLPAWRASHVDPMVALRYE